MSALPRSLAGLATVLAVLAATLTPGSAAFAEAGADPGPCTVDWDHGGGNDSWSDPANWSGDRLPGLDDVVCISAANVGHSVDVDGDGVQVVRAVRSNAAVRVMAPNGNGLRMSMDSYIEGLFVESGIVQTDTALVTAVVEQGGGSVGGAGDITVDTRYRWYGGLQFGSGTTTVTGADTNGFGLYLSGGQELRLADRTVQAERGMRVEQGTTLQLLTGGRLVTRGTSEVPDTGAAVTGNGLFVLQGSLVVEADRTFTVASGFRASQSSQIAPYAGGVVRIAPEEGLDAQVSGSVALGDSAQLRAGRDVIFDDTSRVVGPGTLGTVAATEAEPMLALNGDVDVRTLDVIGGGLLWVAGRVNADDTVLQLGRVVAAPDALTTGTLTARSADLGGPVHVTGDATLEGATKLSGPDTTLTVDGKLTNRGDLLLDDAGVVAHDVDLEAPAGEESGLDLTNASTVEVAGTLTTRGTATLWTDDAYATDLTAGTLAVEGNTDSNVLLHVAPDSTLEVAAGARLVQGGDLTQRGTASVYGTLELNGTNLVGANLDVHSEGHLRVGPDGTVMIADGVTFGGLATDVVNDGTIQGAGTVAGMVTNNGTFMPLDTLNVWGRYTQTASGRLRLRVDSQEAHRLAVDGRTVLDGTLALRRADGAQPRADITDLVTSTERTGQFAQVESADACSEISYGATLVTLVPQPCALVNPGSGVEIREKATFEVRLPRALDHDAVIGWTVEPGTASPNDFAGDLTGSLTVPAGSVYGLVEVGLADDDEQEQDETFTLRLDAQGVRLATPTADGVIIDDDQPLDYAWKQMRVRQGGQHYETGLGTSYAVGLDSPDADTTLGWVFRISDGAFSSPRNGFLPYGINDKDVAVGDCEGAKACVRDHGVDTILGDGRGDPAVINDHGVIGGSVGDGAAYWPSKDSGPVSLGLGQGSRVTDINERGDMVGTTTSNGVRTGWYRAANGTVYDVPLVADMEEMTDLAISDDGLVVGTAYVPDQWGSGPSHGFTWRPGKPLTDLGLGTSAMDVNGTGAVVGMRNARATLWKDGKVIDLNNALPKEAQRVMTLHYAKFINDQGTIQVNGSYGIDEIGGVLVPPGAGCHICLEAGVEEAEFPNPEAFTDAQGEVVEGTPARVRSVVRNNTADAADLTVVVTGADGEPVGDPEQLSLAPNEEQVVNRALPTQGLAWKDGADRGTVQLDVRVTDTAGETVAEYPLDLRVVPRPVVAVHGMNSDASTWAAYDGFTQAAHQGWRTFAVDTMDTSSVVPNTIAQNAAELADYVSRIQRQENAWQVDLVAHSMGGLISRYYIANLMLDHDGIRSARKLVMLGTPNGGSFCADLFTVPMTVELRTDLMAYFNSTVTDRRGVPFSVGAGDPLPLTCGDPGASDGVVSLTSATTGIDDSVVFPTLHTAMTASQQMFSEYVEPRLNGTAGVNSLTAPLTTLAGVVTAATTQPHTPQLLTRDQVTLAPGESTVLGQQVPDGLTAVGTAAMAPESVDLVLDNGTQSASSADDPARGSGFQTARVENPARGSWRLTVTNHGDKTVTVPLSTWAEGDATRLEAHAEQVGIKGGVRVTATLTGDKLDLAIPYMIASATGADGTSLQAELRDDGKGEDKVAGDSVWTGSMAGLKNGPVAIDVTTNDPDFWRTVSTALMLQVGTDGPGNDAPVALSSSVDVPTGELSNITVEAADPEGSELQYEIVAQPQHGTVGGAGPRFDYKPADGYQGPDSFTWRAFDGELYSEPATTSIDVGPARSQVTLAYPADRTTTKGSPTHFLVGVNATVKGETIREGAVTFEFAGHSETVRLDEGHPAETTIPADVPAGNTTLTVRYSGGPHYAPSTLTETIHVLDGAVPVPTLHDVTGEAGYTVRYRVAPGDADGDVATVELDLTGDGTWDVVLPGDGGYGVHADHVFDAAFDGTARARVTDYAGHVATVSAPVHIAPHRDLGALQRLLVDGEPVRATDLSDDGRYVLYRPVHSAVSDKWSVLDRQTGEHEVVSVLPDGTEVDFSGAAYLSPNGRTVAFSGAPSTTAPTWVRDLDTGTTVMASRTTSGEPADSASAPWGVLDDGTVLFESTSRSLAGRDISCDSNNRACMQLYVHSPSGKLERITSPDGGPVEDLEFYPAISRDGRWVAYGAGAKLWLVDRQDGSRRLLADTKSSWDIEDLSVSDDGQQVWFNSAGEGLAPEDTNGYVSDLFHVDVATGKVSVVNTTGAGTSSRRGAGFHEVDRCGNAVFWSDSDDLVPGDTNADFDVFWRGAGSGPTRRVSVEARDGIEGDGPSLTSTISGDGRWVLFQSQADNLVPGDVENENDSFLLDLGASAVCGGTPPQPHVPTAADVSATVDEDATAVVHLEGADLDGDQLTFEVLDGPQHGALTGDAADRSYTPVADWNGTDTFTYRVSDGTSWSETATATVVVTPVNDAPTSGPDLGLGTMQDTAIDVHLTGADVDGDPLTYEVVDAPTHGSLSGAGAARVYTPAPGWSGTDSFTWRVTDGTATSGTSTVTVTVTPAPTPSWPFDGFYAPVDNLPVVNLVQPGSAVPVKFGLGAYRGMDIFADGYPMSRKHACDSSATSDALESTDTAGASGLTWDAGTQRYHYVWKTQKSWSGQCRTLVLKFRDGSEHTAEFRFR